jgi:hypothetical protein
MAGAFSKKALKTYFSSIKRTAKYKPQRIKFHWAPCQNPVKNHTTNTLTYLTHAYLDRATVYDYETKEYTDIYRPELFEGYDPYDVFLSGARTILTIENPSNTSGKELIIFRDSFGSSIAPLLLCGYSKITLVDIRYIPYELLGDRLDFSKDIDVLFLYNTMVFNNSAMLR